MTAVDEVDQLIEQYQLALDEFMKGNPKPVQKLYSHREDASLANPYGPPVRGWAEIAKTTEHAASLRRDGRATGFEIVAKNVTPELAYVVQIENQESKVGEREEINPYALRGGGDVAAGPSFASRARPSPHRARGARRALRNGGQPSVVGPRRGLPGVRLPLPARLNFRADALHAFRANGFPQPFRDGVASPLGA
jgi:hypothetical protein